MAPQVAAEALDLGASVVCVERDPELAAVAATRLLHAAGSRPERVKVITTDLFEVDLSEATAACVQHSGRHGKRHCHSGYHVPQRPS